MKSLIKKIYYFFLKKFYSIFYKTLSVKQKQLLSRTMFEVDKGNMTEGFLPLIHHKQELDDFKDDRINTSNPLKFEDLASLFASNNANHGIIGLTIRMSAYIYKVLNENNYKTAIDVGTHKGGSTILMSVAMGKDSKVHSIDLEDKENRLGSHRPYRDQLANFKNKYNLNIIQYFGDSREIDLKFEQDEIDCVLIDGGHEYEIVKNDYEKFGSKIRVGGSIFFDDCSDEGCFLKVKADQDYMKKLIKNLIDSGKYKYHGNIDRLGHFVRIK